MQIYIHRNNQQLGPFTEAEVKTQLAAGTISPQDHVWWQGQQGWIPLVQSPLMAPGLTPPPVPAPAVPAPTVSYQAKGKTSGLAIASLVCGVVGLACGLLSIAAIVCGHMSRSQIKKDPSLGGSGLALAGLILGYVWLPIYTAIFVISFLIALGNQVKTVNQTSTSQVDSALTSPNSTTNSDQTTNAPDQPTATPTNSPDQSTNSTTATPVTPDPSTNSPDSSTNAAPVSQ